MTEFSQMMGTFYTRDTDSCFTPNRIINIKIYTERVNIYYRNKYMLYMELTELYFKKAI